MSNDQLHILIIPSWYPTKDKPLSGIFFKEQAQGLYNQGVKVGVIYPEVRWLSELNLDKLKANHFQVKEYNEEGIIVFRKHGWNTYPKFPEKQVKSWVKQCLKLFKLYINKYGKPDIIHAQSSKWAGYAAKFIEEKYKIPYVVTEHLSEFARDLIEDWQKPYLMEAFRSADRVLAVSSPYAKIIKEYCYDQEIEVISNSVDTNFFNICNKKSKNKFIFLNVCFLNKNKCVDNLIKAFYEAFKDNKNVELRIGGDGTEKENLQNLINKLNINDQVKLLGKLSREEVREQMSISNAFALSSKFETFGVVLIEALATGIPVVSTKCGGPEDIVNDSVGKLVEVNNIHDLSLGLKYIYENYEKFNSKEIRNYCVNNYSAEAIAKKTIKIYKSLF